MSLSSLWSLVNIGMLVQHKLIKDACIKHTLKHEHISHDFTGHECVLHLLVRDEIVEPVLSKLRNTTHLKEIWWFHISSNSVLFLSFGSSNLADLTKTTVIFAHSISWLVHDLLVRQLNTSVLKLRLLWFKSAIRPYFTGSFLILLLSIH